MEMSEAGDKNVSEDVGGGEPKPRKSEIGFWTLCVLVLIGTLTTLMGFSAYPWIEPRGSMSSAGSDVVYGWWQPLLPLMPILILIALLALSVGKLFFHMAWRRVFWVGIAIAGLISLYPFYQLTNPPVDLPLASLFASSEGLVPGLWLWSEQVAGPAGTGFYVALAGSLLMTVSAIIGVFGRSPTMCGDQR